MGEEKINLPLGERLLSSWRRKEEGEGKIEKSGVYMVEGWKLASTLAARLR
jgi:hypothetical protein